MSKSEKIGMILTISLIFVVIGGCFIYSCIRDEIGLRQSLKQH